MKYLETKHQRNSAKITVLITLILFLLLFFAGPKYLDPPEEYGVAVNFGTSNTGSGNKPLAEPKAAPEEKIVEKTAPEPSKPEQSQPTETQSKSEDLLTQEEAEAIAIKKQKEADAKAKADAQAKAKAEAERIAKEKREAEARKKREEDEKRKKLDNLIGGVKNSKGKDDGGEGNDKQAGNKGQLNGNPYAASYFGGSGPGKGGVGYGLGGRGIPTRSVYKQDCNEYGLVVVRIEVNRQGQVVKATPGIKGTTNKAQCLLEPAKKIALSHKWPADKKAPVKQIGFISINFDIGQ